MEATAVCWDYVGIMEKNSGNYYSMLWLCRDNDKESGNEYSATKKSTIQDQEWKKRLWWTLSPQSPKPQTPKPPTPKA